MGYAAGVALAAVLTTLAISTRFGATPCDADRDVQSASAVALLPMAILWFGIGQPAIVFVIMFSCCGGGAERAKRLPRRQPSLAHDRL